MAYYTGSANSLDDVLSALLSACQLHGWTWADGILSKGSAYLKPTTTDANNPGIALVGGIGKSGGSLLGSSGVRARLGRQGVDGKWPLLTWPATYHVHVGLEPDEVYLVLNCNLTDFYWLAFGKSTLPLTGSGLWFAGNGVRGTSYPQGGGYGMTMTPDGGAVYPTSVCPGIFWGSDGGTWLHAVQIDAGGDWPTYSSGSVGMLAPLIRRQPNAWSGEAVLLPVQEWQQVAEGKCRQVVDAAHARLLRVDNFEPTQVLELGTDRWRVYPFFVKNTAQRDAGYMITHTGTFGWALRE